MQQSHGGIKAMNFIKSSLSLMDSFCPLSSFCLSRLHSPHNDAAKIYFFLITAKLFFRKLIISYPKKCILRELILEKVYDLTFVIIEKVYSRADPFAKTPKAVVGLISQQPAFSCEKTGFRNISCHPAG